MAELEKVIKGLECCLNTGNFEECTENCPYFTKKLGVGVCAENMMRDALSLLKAQEPDKSKYEYHTDHTMDLISRKAAIDALYMNGCCGMGITYLMDCASVPAVPLEPLAKWIVENLDPRCGCSYCSKERVCCDCPIMTEQQVKEKLGKWMEEQDADD